MNQLKELSINLYNQSIDLINERNITEAIELLNNSYFIDNSDIDTLNLLGVCLYNTCEFDKAKYLWSKSVSISEENNRACEYLKIIKSKEMNNLINIYNEGISALSSGKFDIALEKLNDVLSINEEFIEPYIIISLIHLNNNDFICAKEYLEKALVLDKGNDKVKKYYSAVIKKCYRNARTATRKNVRRKKNKAKLIWAVAGILIICICMVMIYYNKVSGNLSSKNENSNLQSNISDLNTKLSEKEDEVNNLEDKIKKTEISMNNLINGTPDEQLKFKNTWDVLQEGLRNYKSNEFKQAIINFNYVNTKSLDDNEKSESTFWLAKCYKNITNYDMAVDEYKTYVDKYKDKDYCDDSLYDLANILYKEGKVDEAKTYAKKMEEEYSNSMYNNDIIKNILNN